MASTVKLNISVLDRWDLSFVRTHPSRNAPSLASFVAAMSSWMAVRFMAANTRYHRVLCRSAPGPMALRLCHSAPRTDRDHADGGVRIGIDGEREQYAGNEWEFRLRGRINERILTSHHSRVMMLPDVFRPGEMPTPDL